MEHRWVKSSKKDVFFIFLFLSQKCMAKTHTVYDCTWKIFIDWSPALAQKARIFSWLPHWTPGWPNHIILNLSFHIYVIGMVRLASPLQSILKCKKKQFILKKKKQNPQQLLFVLPSSFFFSSKLTLQFPSNSLSFRTKRSKCLLHVSFQNFAGKKCVLQAVLPPPLLFEILLKYYFGLKEENQSFHGWFVIKGFLKTQLIIKKCLHYNSSRVLLNFITKQQKIISHLAVLQGRGCCFWGFQISFSFSIFCVSLFLLFNFNILYAPQL